MNSYRVFLKQAWLGIDGYVDVVAVNEKHAIRVAIENLNFYGSASRAKNRHKYQFKATKVERLDICD